MQSYMQTNCRLRKRDHWWNGLQQGGGGWGGRSGPSFMRPLYPIAGCSHWTWIRHQMLKLSCVIVLRLSFYKYCWIYFSHFFSLLILCQIIIMVLVGGFFSMLTQSKNNLKTYLFRQFLSEWNVGWHCSSTFGEMVTIVDSLLIIYWRFIDGLLIVVGTYLIWLIVLMMD